MRELIDEDRNNPDIQAVAAHIFRREGLHNPRDYVDRAAAIHRWVRDGMIYVHEPVEKFMRPRRSVLQEWYRFGDCDCKVLACATLHESVGYPTELEALGWDVFQHVFHWVGVPPGKGARGVQRVYACETTLPVDFGWNPREALERRHASGLGPVAGLAELPGA
ncbi:MAG: hypothetical protein ACRENJ_00295, partial [Candidatus Eiseniibacteriota bacterium]